jgi:phosphoribosyl-dephospho-CoA transferase
MELSALRSHYLLNVNRAEVILANDRDNQWVPSWVLPALLETSCVVVRRGTMTSSRIPVGIRGEERSQRWAAWCPANAIRQIVTPADLLRRFETTKDSLASPASGSLRSLAAAWRWLTHSWGPGGSAGFELATGKRTMTSRSDLDIVVYANEPLSRSDARRLLVCTSALDLEMAVDIRVETPVCGFALAEYARSSGKPILLRTFAGPILGDNPWNADLSRCRCKNHAEA